MISQLMFQSIAAYEPASTKQALELVLPTGADRIALLIAAGRSVLGLEETHFLSKAEYRQAMDMMDYYPTLIQRLIFQLKIDVDQIIHKVKYLHGDQPCHMATATILLQPTESEVYDEMQVPDTSREDPYSNRHLGVGLDFRIGSNHDKALVLVCVGDVETITVSASRYVKDLTELSPFEAVAYFIRNDEVFGAIKIPLPSKNSEWY